MAVAAIKYIDPRDGEVHSTVIVADNVGACVVTLALFTDYLRRQGHEADRGCSGTVSVVPGEWPAR